MASKMLVRGHVATGGAGIRVTHCILNVLQRHAGVIEAGREGVAQAMRAELASGLQPAARARRLDLGGSSINRGRLWRRARQATMAST